MKSMYDAGKGHNVPDRHYGPTAGDDLVLPGGSLVRNTANGDLARILIGAGVEGASHHAGRPENVARYAEHLARITDVGGRAFVEDWLTKAATRLG